MHPDVQVAIPTFVTEVAFCCIRAVERAIRLR
jgi:hypothetical protein